MKKIFKKERVNMKNKGTDELILEDYDPSVIIAQMRVELENDTQDWTRFKDIMASEKMQGYINQIVSFGSTYDGSAGEWPNLSSDITQLVYVLSAMYNYSGDESPVSDYDYDRLYDMMIKMGQPEIITTPIRSSNKRTVSHRYLDLRGTLTKVYSFDNTEDERHEKRGSVDNWIDRIETATGLQNLRNLDVFVFPKWDGVSIEFEFDDTGAMIKALTRGDTEKNLAQDVTEIFEDFMDDLMKIDDLIELRVPHGLQTELLFPENKLAWYNARFQKDYKTPRSIVSAFVNSMTDSTELNTVKQMLTFKALRVQREENINSGYTELAKGAFMDDYISCELNDFAKMEKFAKKHHITDGFNCDGIVIRFVDDIICKQIGRKGVKSSYEVAYKFAEEVAYTKVKGIKWSLTGYGKMWPNVILQPVTMHGCTITCPSLGSVRRFNEMHLALDDTVKVLYDIVPYVMYNEDDPKCKRSGKLPIEAPIHCPECGTVLEVTDTSITCPNPDCECRKRAKLEQYLKRIGCKGIGEATINALWDTGYVRTILDLYKVTDPDMMDKICNEYDTIYESTMQILLHELNVHHNIPLHTFLSALCIENVSEQTFKRIEAEYDLDDLIFEAENSYCANLKSIKGIGSKTASVIAVGILDNKKLIKKLLKYVDVTQNPNVADPSFRITFHKIRDEEMEKYIEAKGGEVGGQSKATTALCIPNTDIGVDAKVQWALDNDIPVIKFKDLKKFVDDIS